MWVFFWFCLVLFFRTQWNDLTLMILKTKNKNKRKNYLVSKTKGNIFYRDNIFQKIKAYLLCIDSCLLSVWWVGR